MMAALGPGCVKRGCDAASTALVLAVTSGKIAGICSVTLVEAGPEASRRQQFRSEASGFKWWSWQPAVR
jgi:hypothetical protein